jgi:hypothetical protein
MEYNLIIKKDEIVQLAGKYIELGIMVLREVRQAKERQVSHFFLICGI